MPARIMLPFSGQATLQPARSPRIVVGRTGPVDPRRLDADVVRVRQGTHVFTVDRLDDRQALRLASWDKPDPQYSRNTKNGNARLLL